MNLTAESSRYTAGKQIIQGRKPANGLYLGQKPGQVQRLAFRGISGHSMARETRETQRKHEASELVRVVAKIGGIFCPNWLETVAWQPYLRVSSDAMLHGVGTVF